MLQRPALDVFLDLPGLIAALKQIFSHSLVYRGMYSFITETMFNDGQSE